MAFWRNIPGRFFCLIGCLSAHPFDRVFTGNAKTVKRSLSITDVHRIQSLKVPEGARREWRQLVFDVFLFCLYAGGMPLVDAAFLRHDQIQDDHIVYHRRKTGEQVKIPLNSEIRHLINQYKGNGEHEVFPLLNGHEHENHDDLFMRLTSRYNRTLNVLGKLAGVQKKLTHYVARHTWATIASSLAIPVYSISRCLGHTNVRTTQRISDSVNVMSRIVTLQRSIKIWASMTKLPKLMISCIRSRRQKTMHLPSD